MEEGQRLYIGGSPEAEQSFLLKAAAKLMPRPARNFSQLTRQQIRREIRVDVKEHVMQHGPTAWQAGGKKKRSRIVRSLCKQRWPSRRAEVEQAVG
jgi:hypothetical protein